MLFFIFIRFMHKLLQIETLSWVFTVANAYLNDLKRVLNDKIVHQSMLNLFSHLKILQTWENFIDIWLYILFSKNLQNVWKPSSLMAEILVWKTIHKNLKLLLNTFQNNFTYQFQWCDNLKSSESESSARWRRYARLYFCY